MGQDIGKTPFIVTMINGLESCLTVIDVLRRNGNLPLTIKVPIPVWKKIHTELTALTRKDPIRAQQVIHNNSYSGLCIEGVWIHVDHNHGP